MKKNYKTKRERKEGFALEESCIDNDRAIVSTTGTQEYTITRQ